uniref:E3 ubiquitin-protein ligase TRIM56-like n=1 Tax=Crassostrea virginica TaxID=6565 RepID=A0A8B8B2X4_CRAVI|nr:E3 ubiquitin-protein ligase TRIM56-like [Crassostrea virginica]
MADSSLESPSIDRDKFRCPICLEEVRDPKDLPCFHTFCKSCIQTYISSTAACTGDQSVKTIECPVCRKSITAPRNDVSSEEWACGLPQNKLIVSMSVDTEQSENINCMFCLRRSKTVEAKNWCKTCVEAICEDCKSFHLCVPSLQSHKIVSLSDVGNLNNNIEINEPCPIHKGKFLEVFCQDHDQLCCSICFATKHRACGKVEAIEDVAAELNSLCPQMTPTCFIDALKKLEDIQEEYRNNVEKLNTRKQEICACTENKVEEIIALINKAHDQWMKQFNQNHSDAVGNIEIASDEVKRYAMTIQEAKTLLEKVIDHGSPKQIFITRYKNNKQRRAVMAQKDWMKIKLEKVSEFKQSSYIYFGLFLDDAKILLSVENPPSLQIYDVTDTTATCVCTFPCPSIPYGLCYSGESMDKVYVSFGTHVEHYQIEIYRTVTIRKIETILLEREMIAISRGSSVIFSRSNTERMICDTNFSVNHKARCEKKGNRPFLSVSFQYDQQAFVLDGKNLVIVDENNKEVLNCPLSTYYARGLAFDLQENIFVCMMSNKLRQIKHGGGESRDIDLPGIQQSYNVVLHPTGEKVMVLDNKRKFCVYNVV